MKEQYKAAISTLVLARDNVKSLKKPYHGSFGNGIDAAVERIEILIKQYEQLLIPEEIS